MCLGTVTCRDSENNKSTITSRSSSDRTVKSDLTWGEFKLTVYRQYPGKKCTSGYLEVDGTIVSYTLERPWADNQQNISSIPSGTYHAHLRYDHSDNWR